ncbi:MAG: hypothetical protein VKN72_04770 [Nostocales cyanobacterium 94392]|nr:hypothetical protein [Nostocales cyanobacterium 94392]
MTKKDFLIVAGVIKTDTEIWREQLDKWNACDWTDKQKEEKTTPITAIIENNGTLVEALSKEFSKVNPRFNTSKFMAACGFK